MAFKGSVHHGTPVNHIRSGGAGVAPGRPEGMQQTVKPQFASDNRGYQDNPRGGTPYNSDAGNPGDARRTAEGTGLYGVVLSENGQDHNNFRSNGDGTVFDKMRGDYHDPVAAPHLDSPVPSGAARFDTSDIAVENRAHLGKGSGPTAPNDAQARDDLLAIGGTMSR
jgi:hypothetical protein